jgi:putative restriction endonuclease
VNKSLKHKALMEDYRIMNVLTELAILSGARFPDRRALHDAGVHPGSLQGGISTSGESIILSGGYVDDIDEGDLIIYTGQGGRDSKTGRQV